MKRLLLSICVAMTAIGAFAVKALTVPTVYTQSDGTKITVFLHGDENFSWYTDDTGNILLRNGNDFSIYTGSKEDFFEAAEASKSPFLKRTAAPSSSFVFPHTGTPKVLVILCNFSDSTFKLPDPKVSFDRYLNGNIKEGYKYTNSEDLNYGSVKEYFNAMSGGDFKPQFDIYGPINLPNTFAHYGANGSDKDTNAKEMITDAAKILDASVNFKDYDNNGDNYADLVYIIYAGYGENVDGNSSDCIWPKSTSIDSDTEYDGIKIRRCGLSNELNGTATSFAKPHINGIGLFIHEFSHCLGLPDFYTTTYATTETQKANNQEMEFWSIMDAGCYSPRGNGTKPCAYTAWERESMGWCTIDDLTSAGKITLTDIDDGGKAYRIKNDNDKSGNEYFILQNIQNKNWNCKAEGHGLLISHVQYDSSIFSLNKNTVNNTLGHPRMTVVAADGILLNKANASSTNSYKDYYTSMAGDPFPGTSGNKFFTDTSTVKPIIYTGEQLGKPIYNITENEDGTISFYFMTKPDVSAINATTVDTDDKDTKIYNINGQFIGTDKSALPKGLYIINKKKVIIK